jgi:hypothetical protein
MIAHLSHGWQHWHHPTVAWRTLHNVFIFHYL